MENSGIDFGTRNHIGQTPLQCAYENKDSINTGLSMLQRFPNKVNVPDNLNNGSYMLHIVCESGNLELLKVICGNFFTDVNFNVVDDDGNTPVHLACMNGHLEVVKLLAQHGADLNVTNRYNVTPLQYAYAKKQDKVAEFIKMTVDA